MKKLIFSAFLILNMLSVCTNAFAMINSTKQPTAGNDVYIAGNPDLYPLEFYNGKTKRYEGILPELYSEISKQTGISFSYIAADNENRQKQLGENLQAEIVSAYNKGDIETSEEIELFSYESGGVTQTVCIGFTKIISEDVANTVRLAVQNADKSMWMSAAMQLKDGSQSSKTVVRLAAVICVLAVALICVILYALKKHRMNNEKNKTRAVDALTGIGNMSYFEDCYSHHVSPSLRSAYHVLYIAVDIEKIETYFGLAESEELQRYAANVITDAMGDNDFAARIDNGVFLACVICPDTERAVIKATELVNSANCYNESYAKDNGVSFRCGIYQLDKQNITLETVVYNARQGYLHAVNEKQDVCVCDENILNRVTLKSRLQKKISNALKNEEFHIYLQFMFDTRNNNLCGAEVLSRWHSVEEGVLLPSNYIEDMQLAGMIDSLDFYVLDKTCQTLSGWRGTDYEKLYLSCNFTRSTVSEPDFAQRFEEILLKYDFDKSKLVVELTEDSLVNDSMIAYKSVLSIRSFGCKVAIDDFGMGYTSFSDLCDYPIDIIKIDRHIVTKAATERGNAVLISIIRMAHSLGIKVLCEGIETENEREKAVDADSDYIQGYLFSRVLPIENALDFYKNNQ